MNALRERADEDRHRFINVQKAFTEADIRAEQLEEEHDKLHLKINRLTKENKRLTHQLQIVENELNQVLRAHERVKAKSGR
jgi:chaperonin cofactor prefoldin